jgi:hypothetical protein
MHHKDEVWDGPLLNTDSVDQSMIADDEGTSVSRYRPLDDYAFNSDLTEGTSPADDGPERSQMQLGRTVTSRQQSTYRLGAGPNELSGTFRDRGDHRKLSWGSSSSSLKDRGGVSERLGSTGPSSESIYMNIVPNKNSASKILFNFVALWNNSKTRAALRHLVRQVSIGVLRGSIALNVPSLVRLWMLVEPIESGGAITNRPRSDALRRYQEEISGPVRMFSQGGDALIDYMDMKRQSCEDGSGVNATEIVIEESEVVMKDSDRSERLNGDDENKFHDKSDVPVQEIRDFPDECEKLYEKLLQFPQLKLDASRPVVVGRVHLLIALLCTHTVLLFTVCGATIAITFSLTQ